MNTPVFQLNLTKQAPAQPAWPFTILPVMKVIGITNYSLIQCEAGQPPARPGKRKRI